MHMQHVIIMANYARGHDVVCSVISVRCRMRWHVTKPTHVIAVNFNPVVSQRLTILCSSIKVGITGSFPLVTLSECDLSFSHFYVFHRKDTDDKQFV